jgi:hypothetical protein
MDALAGADAMFAHCRYTNIVRYHHRHSSPLL